MKTCAMLSIVIVTFVALMAAIPAGVNAAAPYVALYGDTLGGLGGVCHSRCDVFLQAPFTVIEYWIWFKPDPAKGMAAGEFKIQYPSGSYTAVPMDVTANPLVQVELGSLGAGMSFSLGEQNCQYDWFWSHWQEMLIMSETRALAIQVAPHPATGHLSAGSCEPGFPIYDINILNHFVINQSCYCALGNSLLCAEMMGLHGVDGVEYTSFTSLDVSLYPDVHDCTAAPYEDNFLLRSTAVPPETIEVAQAARTGIGLYRLTLAAPMVDGTSYILEARNICSCEGCSPACESSSWQFVFDASVGARESSWGAIKNLYKK